MVRGIGNLPRSMFVRNTLWLIDPISGSRPLYGVNTYRFWQLAYTRNLLNLILFTNDAGTVYPRLIFCIRKKEPLSINLFEFTRLGLSPATGLGMLEDVLVGVQKLAALASWFWYRLPRPDTW